MDVTRGGTAGQDQRMTAFEFDGVVAALYRDGSSAVLEGSLPSGSHRRLHVGAPLMTRNAPHRGEFHPDGDELLYVISGRIDVVLDDGDQETVGTERIEPVQAGEAFIVPKGVWHRVDVLEPTHLVHITPGPGDGHRPL